MAVLQRFLDQLERDPDAYLKAVEMQDFREWLACPVCADEAEFERKLSFYRASEGGRSWH